jgi:hypothetical protein
MSSVRDLLVKAGRQVVGQAEKPLLLERVGKSLGDALNIESFFGLGKWENRVITPSPTSE